MTEEYLDLVLMRANITNYKYFKRTENEEGMKKTRENYERLRISAEKKKIPGIENFLINIENMLK